MVLFGEAEKGQYRKAYYCRTLPELVDNLGNAPNQSKGLFYAVQALLYHRDLLFIRVQEEGINHEEYLSSLYNLHKEEQMPKISAICVPGVGDNRIIDGIIPYCQLYHSLLIFTEADLYDYLTCFSS